MRLSTFILSVFVLIACLLTLSTEANKAPTRVLELTPNNFDDYISSERQEKYVFVLYCAKWSRQCKPLEPLWDHFSMTHSTTKLRDIVTIAKVQADKYPELAARMSIHGYPTIRYYTPQYPDGLDYSNAREPSLFSSFVFQFT